VCTLGHGADQEGLQPGRDVQLASRLGAVRRLLYSQLYERWRRLQLRLDSWEIEELHEFSRKNIIRRKVATQKAKDLINREVARLRVRTAAALVRQRQPGRQRAAVRASCKKGRAKVKKAKTYWCDLCSQAYVSALDLQDHNASRKHKLRKWNIARGQSFAFYCRPYDKGS